MKSKALLPPPLLPALGIGDAYGAPFEFRPAEMVHPDNDGERYHAPIPPRPVYAENQRTIGHYTDDTQMSLAIAEALAERAPWTPRSLADRFVQVYQRDERPGYGSIAYILKRCKNGADFLRLVTTDNTCNEAAMRALPIGVLPTVAKVKEYAAIQAKITHNTTEGILSSQAIALIAHYGLKRLGKPANLPAFLKRHLGGSWDRAWSGRVPSDGFPTVRAVLTVLIQNRTLHDILRASVAFTGDTDTVAGLALGAAACFPDYKRNLSPNLLSDLEDKRYGRRYLFHLNQKLFDG